MSLPEFGGGGPLATFWEILIWMRTSYTRKKNRFIHMSLWDEGWGAECQESEMTSQRTVSTSVQPVLRFTPKMEVQHTSKKGASEVLLPPLTYCREHTLALCPPSPPEGHQIPSPWLQTSNVERSWGHRLEWRSNESFEPCPQKIVTQ